MTNDRTTSTTAPSQPRKPWSLPSSQWWVPGLQIGYEHTFIHQAADFFAGLSSGKPAAPTFC